MLEEIRHCLKLDKILFTKHAKDEMENEELGEIRENEVSELSWKGR
jgi:hypothetical protein